MMLTEQEIYAMEARANSATQGQWKLEREELNDEDFSDEEQDREPVRSVEPATDAEREEVEHD